MVNKWLILRGGNMCKYCKSNNQKSFLSISGYGVSYVKMFTNQENPKMVLVMDAEERGTASANIYYCPFCGRDLLNKNKE